MVSISIHFFGKPEWEFGETISPKEIKAKGDELKKRLYEIGDAMEKLSAGGWEHSMALYDIHFDKEISKKEAQKELKRLGIQKEIYHIDEYEEE